MKPSRFQLVVVDLMGTLADSGAVTAHLLAESLAAQGIETSPEEVRSVLGLPLRRAIAALFRTGSGVLADARRADAAHDQLVASLEAHYRRAGSVREIEGATAAFIALRAQGLRIAIATVMPTAVSEVLTASLDWFDRGLIDTLVSAHEVDTVRPQPGMIIEAMRRTGIEDAARVMKVGATPADLAEGTIGRCGAVVGLTSGSHGRDELVLRPHTHLVDRMVSLLDVLALLDCSMPAIEPSSFRHLERAKSA